MDDHQRQLQYEQYDYDDQQCGNGKFSQSNGMYHECEFECNSSRHYGNEHHSKQYLELDQNSRSRYDIDCQWQHEHPKCIRLRFRAKYVPMVSNEEWLYQYRHDYDNEQGSRCHDDYSRQPNGMCHDDELASQCRRRRRNWSMECNDRLRQYSSEQCKLIQQQGNRFKFRYE